MPPKISIIVPNWNGRDFLARCIGGLLQSAEEAGAPFELLLMDDASTDGSAGDVAKKFPQVRLVEQRKNRGFGYTVNHGARLATGEILLLVNNDLVPREGFVENLCRHFKGRDDLFGVSGKTVDWEAGSPNHVNMTADFTGGGFRLKWSDDASIAPTMFMQGGSCAVRRDLFLRFGGLCDLYAPAYWEDYDLSYQALKAGFANVYDPEAVGSHLGQGSMIRAYGEERVQYFKLRNRLLFHALNLTDPDLVKAFWKSVPSFVKSGGEARFQTRFKAFLFLWNRRAAIRKERQRRAEEFAVSDAELLEQFSGKGTLC